MSTTETRKRTALRAIARQAPQIAAFSEQLMHTPETGFAEHRTAEQVRTWLGRLEVPHRSGLAITGISGMLRGRSARPCVALIGELDALTLPEHPLADPTTGAAHACGHHAQLAAVVGAAVGLREVVADLDGSVAFIAAPAEELDNLDERLELRARGEIEFSAGKAELLRLGVFDAVDMALLAHTGRGSDPAAFSVGDRLNGSLVKRSRFTGRSAHAGSTPWQGINAVQAASLALHALDAQRDTYPDSHGLRVNSVLREAGTASGAVPASAVMETMIRARSTEALAEATSKANRALRSGALALGARVEIETLLAYLPHTPTAPLDDVVATNAREVTGQPGRDEGRQLGACTDMGDLGHVMPVSHPYTAGASGGHHSVDYRIADHHRAAVEPAQYLAGTVIDLLSDDAARAHEILATCPAPMTIPDYLALRRDMSTTETYDEET